MTGPSIHYSNTHHSWQVYGFGNSERFIREFSASTGLEPDVATKFGPLPWRQSAGSLVKACKVGWAREPTVLQPDSTVHGPCMVSAGSALILCHGCGTRRAPLSTHSRFPGQLGAPGLPACHVVLAALARLLLQCLCQRRLHPGPGRCGGPGAGSGGGGVQLQR